MNDSFDDELRRSLHKQADGLPRVPDLSKGAISRAHGIRRRRQVAGIAAAAALVAIAVPIGLRVGDVMSNGQDPIAPATTGPTLPTPTATPTEIDPSDPTQSAPTTPDESDPTTPGDTGPSTPNDPVQVSLDLQELPEGDAPTAPYLDGSTVVAYGNTIEVSGAVDGVASVTDGVYVAGAWDNGWPLTRYAANGNTEERGKVQIPPIASSDGRWVAYTTREAGQATLVLLDEGGEPSSVDLAGGSSVTVEAIVDGTVYFSGGGYPALQSWSTGDARPTQVPGDLRATAVSSDGTLVGRPTSVENLRACASIVNLATGEETPEHCGDNFQIQGFSPDGRYAWASNAEGYAATGVYVLDTQTGEVIREYASQRNTISFMDATFEDSDSLLIRAEQNDGTALVRCDVTSMDCELAAPLADGTSLTGTGSPYLLGDVQ
jgi:hypothetical protein